MSDLERDALKIAQHLYDSKCVSGKSMIVSDLKKAVRIYDEDFELADSYLLEAKYSDGTMGGESGQRWLNPAGVEFLASRSKEKSKKRWSRADIMTLVGVLLALAAIAVSLLIPEVRRWLRLE